MEPVATLVSRLNIGRWIRTTAACAPLEREPQKLLADPLKGLSLPAM